MPHWVVAKTRAFSGGRRHAQPPPSNGLGAVLLVLHCSFPPVAVWWSVLVLEGLAEIQQRSVTVQQVCGLSFYVNVEMSSAVM